MTNTAKTPHPATAGHSERNISFDLIRILAIFLVMYNHRETYIFYHHVPRMGLRYILSMCGAAFCKCGPPLFFMVSGALILHKKESFRRIFRHRILRILIVMVILSILIVALIPDSDSFLKTFFSGLNWYLYAYIGYLLMLPFLRILVNHMTRKDMQLFFILTAIAYSVSGILIPFRGVEEHLPDSFLFSVHHSEAAAGTWHFRYLPTVWSVFPNTKKTRPEKSGCF